MAQRRGGMLDIKIYFSERYNFDLHVQYSCFHWLAIIGKVLIRLLLNGFTY